ncbi:MAG TPA: nucleoside hydrolase [Bacteroidota bacterium]|nr:nucleoside hydrolase [Bacteroidota bacterium]
MKPTPILLDVDAGVDDTLAIMFALLSPSLDVRAITTVAGNAPVHFCTRNVLLTLDRLSPFVSSIPPVAQGTPKPLRRKLFTALDVHGPDGIGGAAALYSKPVIRPIRAGAVETILAVVERNPDLTIVATGPLTNIAVAMKKNFRAMRRVREIVVMGGAFKGSWNTGPAAEFNFYVDPDAADYVLHSEVPVRLIPLNVTEQCFLTPRDLRAIAEPSLRKYVEAVTRFYFQFHRRSLGIAGGYLHDPLAVAAVAHPALLESEEGYVYVETKGMYARGLSLFHPPLDVRKEAELPAWVKTAQRRPPSVRVATGVDASSFKRKFLDTLKQKR